MDGRMQASVFGGQLARVERQPFRERLAQRPVDLGSSRTAQYTRTKQRRLVSVGVWTAEASQAWR